MEVLLERCGVLCLVASMLCVLGLAFFTLESWSVSVENFTFYVSQPRDAHTHACILLRPIEK